MHAQIHLHSLAHKKKTSSPQKSLSLHCKQMNRVKNCMETGQESQKSIVETQKKYDDITFRNNFRICKGSLNELQKQQAIDEKLWRTCS